MRPIQSLRASLADPSTVRGVSQPDQNNERQKRPDKIIQGLPRVFDAAWYSPDKFQFGFPTRIQVKSSRHLVRRRASVRDTSSEEQ